jgi:hypothetical protein
LTPQNRARPASLLEVVMRKILASVTAAALVAGCAGWNGYAVAPGTSRDEVLARFGSPQQVVRLPAGERLQYSQQPMGRTAWMIDLDASGRVLNTHQALTAENLNRVVPGQWTLDDVQREFGPPARVDRVAGWNGSVLNYQWRTDANIDMQYAIYVDGRNVVGRAHPAMEYNTVPDSANGS